MRPIATSIESFYVLKVAVIIVQLTGYYCFYLELSPCTIKLKFNRTDGNVREDIDSLCIQK